MKNSFIKSLALIPLSWGLVSRATAQSDNGTFALSGYLESYYLYDLHEPEDHQRPYFLYNHIRHNEFSVNLAYLKGTYQGEKLRANLAFMAGTYAQYNLSAEEDMLKHLYEANIGLRLGAGTWLDAGVLPSYIGFESAASQSCWTLTRSIGAENSPYYLTGVKLTHQVGEKWTLAATINNGWQRIRRVEGNSTPGVGTQVQFSPNENILLNSSTFIGNDKPDSVRQMRYFHNFYGIFQLTDNFGLAAGFDIGWEEKPGTEGFNNWFSPVLIGRYRFSEKISVAIRGEYYQDEAGVMIGTGTPNGFKTFGYSLNLDYAPVRNALLRIEGRLFVRGGQKAFQNERFFSKWKGFLSKCEDGF